MSVSRVGWRFSRAKILPDLDARDVSADIMDLGGMGQAAPVSYPLVCYSPGESRGARKEVLSARLPCENLGCVL